ncbi:MAG: hypothetical protein J6M47_09300 [Clostridia bacterium]|nr:hypothetical protein [Clostridia bacterium]
MKAVGNRIAAMASSLDRACTRLRLPLGMASALLLAALIALHNISSGPLHNLNDIGGWHNRALFIAMTACVHLAAMGCAAAMGKVRFSRVLLRQLILTAGVYILLQGINQKTFAYVTQVQPIVRAMDEGGLAAGLAMGSSLSAPALTLLYLITRGPVYDMYLVKLFAIACLLGLSLLAAYAADRNELGIRAEALLALCMILPQGFLNAACTAHIEIAAALLTAVSLALSLSDRPRMRGAWLCLGAAAALSGAALYALPVLLYRARGAQAEWRFAGIAAAIPLAACIPAILCGMGAGEAIASLFHAQLAVPDVAGGAPNLLSILPRANPMETTAAFMLGRLEAVDLVTNAQPFYTQAHFEQMALGLSLAGLALYMGACALAWRSEKPALHRGLMLLLAALICCPAATTSCWLLADIACLYAILAAPALRLPACLVLFATAGGSCYPALGETLLPPMAAFLLCLIAACMLFDVIPMGVKARKE